MVVLHMDLIILYFSSVHFLTRYCKNIFTIKSRGFSGTAWISRLHTNKKKMYNSFILEVSILIFLFYNLLLRKMVGFLLVEVQI